MVDPGGQGRAGRRVAGVFAVRSGPPGRVPCWNKGIAVQSVCGPENLPPCIVCGARAVQVFAVIDTLRYYRCAVCEATFLDPSQRLSREDEHQRYRLHKNDPADPGYRRFITRRMRERYGFEGSPIVINMRIREKRERNR